MSLSSTPGDINTPAESIEKKVYSVVNDLTQYLPITNDRNRLGFDLYKYVIGEGDEPLVTIRNAKVKLQGISVEELAKLITYRLKSLNGNK